MKKPVNCVSEILYELLEASTNRKAISCNTLHANTHQANPYARISDIRAEGVEVKHFKKKIKNKFGRKTDYAIFYIPYNQLDQARELYERLNVKSK